MSNPNKNSLNVVINSTSKGRIFVDVASTTGNIIIDLTKPCNPCNIDPMGIKINNPNGNVNISSAFPSDAVIHSIMGNLKVNPDYPYQVIILYDKNNNILPSNIRDYSTVRKIEAHYNNWTPPKTDYTGMIIGIIVGVLLLAGIGYGIYYYYYKKKSKSIIKGGLFNVGE